MTIYLIGMPGGQELLFLLMLWLPTIILPVAALISILRNKFKDSTTKLIWVIVTIFLPILGALLYFIIGRNQRIQDSNKTTYSQ